MKNSKGSSLALAIGAMVLFSGIGVGSLNYSMMQGKTSTTQALSAQAFWAADAGLEKAKTLVTTYTSSQTYPVTLPADTNISTGTYTTVITLPIGKPWTITSTGTSSNSQINQKIFAQLGYSSLTSALSTTGTVNTNGNPTINGTISQSQSAANFQTVFGITKDQAQKTATNTSTYYDCTANNHPCGNGNNVSILAFTNKLAYVKLSSNQTLKLSGGWTSTGFLIVDGGSLDMSGAGNQAVNFTGIIWIEGGSFSSIGGGVNITGSVYINGNANTTTSVNGSSVTITYNSVVVSDIMEAYASGTANKVVTTCWSEVSC